MGCDLSDIVSENAEVVLRQPAKAVAGSDQELDRWAFLAVIRFVLALIVLLGHTDFLFSQPAYLWWTHAGVYLNQGSAVYGFLIISGYSIAASLDRSQRGFYGRRYLRIYPTYLASLALALIAGFLISGNPIEIGGAKYTTPTIGAFIVALLMLQSFVAPTLSTDGQLWTLAVEWWNYMLAPVFRKIPTWALVVLVFVSLTVNKVLPSPGQPDRSYEGRMFLILSWYWIVGFIYERHRGTPIGYVLLFAPILVAYNEFWVGRAAVIGILAVALCDTVRLPAFARRYFDWLGELSYPIYAVHVPVFIILLHYGIKSPVIVAVIAILASIAVLHIVDLPLRTYSRRVIRNVLAARSASDGS